MTAVTVMAGGKGTRIRPLTLSRPKPLVPVANRPMLDYIIHKIVDSGHNEIIMSLGYLKEQISSYVKSRFSELNFKFSMEKKPLGTAGGFKKAVKGISETFIVLSGDVLFDLNLIDMLKFHRKKKALVTIALTPVDDPSHYGIAVVDRDMRIKRFLEKPEPHEVFSKIANAGIYIIEPEVIDEIPDGECDFSRDVFPKLIKKDAGVYGFLFRGYWNDVGKPNTFLRANHDVLKGFIRPGPAGKLKVEKPGVFGNIWVGKNVDIGKRVRIAGPVVIGDCTRIEDNVFISGGTVLGPNVMVGRGTYIKGSVVLDGTVIEEGSHLKNCVVDENCRISRSCVVDSCALLGRGVRMGDGTKLRAGRSISNKIKIMAGSLLDTDYPLSAE